MLDQVLTRNSNFTSTSQSARSSSRPNHGTNHTNGNKCDFEEFENGMADSELDGNDLEPIAICGFSIKFPQEATSPEAFWEVMCEKRCAMTEFPKTRFNKDGFYRNTKKRNTLPVRGGHFIEEDLDVFDANFFSISPLEASSMDPMQRWLLEAAFRALENAGITMEEANGSSTAVFTGSFNLDWMLQLNRDPESPPTYAASGFGLSMLANRLSWFFNLTGPSIGLDSACSSTAMAIDMACQSLRNGSCDTSMVAGCNLTFAPEPFVWMSNINFLSPDSRCKSFDHRANGYARGEGIGVMILKRLSDAIKGGNTIRAVIRSTGSNEDGRTPGITQPSRTAQERLVRETYKRAGLSLAHTRYFEAHGTGTAIGDPREAQAIGSAFQNYRSMQDPVYVGAVKSNIGHLEGASGLAGVIKAVLVLEKGIIPPIANFEKLNEKIDAEYLRLKFPQKCEPWPSSGLRRASIASFGYGGANSHIVLDDAYNFLRLRGLSAKHCTVPSPPASCPDLGLLEDTLDPATIVSSTPKLLVWSSTDQRGVKRLTDGYQEYHRRPRIQQGSQNNYMDNLAFTLASHRSLLPWRSFAVTHSLADLVSKSCLSEPVQARATPPRLGFIFTGQGAQWHAMGRELKSYTVFKCSVESADLYIQQLGCSWSVTNEMFKSSEESNIDTPELSQTLCTVLQVALVDLLRTFLVEPAAVVGHSSGEIAAAYCGGYISREAAWKLAYFRGLVSSKLAKSCSKTRTSMISVGLSEEAVKPYLSSIDQSRNRIGLHVACVNSPRNVTVSGDESLIDQLKDQLDTNSVFARKLRVTLAYHSPQMNTASKEYVQLAGFVDSSRASLQVPMISSVTAKRASRKQLTTASYWAQNMVSPVQFSDAVLAMCEQSALSLTKKLDKRHLSASVVDHLIEIGPHAALQGPIRDILRGSPRGQQIGYTSMLYRNKDATITVMNTMGQLHCKGVQVNLRAVNEPEDTPQPVRSLLINLPEYPFDHSQKYWYESRISRNYKLRSHAPLDLLGARSNDWNLSDCRWRNFLRTTEMPWMEQHKVNGATLYPGAGMLIMAIEGAKQLVRPSEVINNYVLRDVHFEKAMDFSRGSGVLETQVSLRPIKSTNFDGNPLYHFTIYSVEGDDWRQNCHGTIEIQFREDTESWTSRRKAERIARLAASCQKVISSCTIPIDTDEMYTALARSGLEYGTSFQKAQEQHISEFNEATARVFLYDDEDSEVVQPHVVHPTSLDAVMHVCFTAFSSGGAKSMATSVPSKLSYMWISDCGLSAADSQSVKTFSKLTSTTHRGFRVDTGALDSADDNQLRLFIEGLELTNVTRTPTANALELHPDQTYYHIIHGIALKKLSSQTIVTHLESLHPANADPTEFFSDVRPLLKTALTRLTKSIDPETFEDERLWKKYYWNWAQHQLDTDLRSIQTALTFDQLCERLIKTNTAGRMYAEVAQNLVAMFTGGVDPLELLFNSDLAKAYYDEISSYKSVRQLASYMDMLVHENPGLAILEVGGGTGAGTRSVIQTLKTHTGGDTGTLRCGKYDFTDISPSFFEKARERFHDVRFKLNYKVLDVEQDLVSQGFERNSYDAVLAVNVIHATRSISTTLRNLRMAMKAGAKLIVQEPLKPNGGTVGFIFGLLPGWWLGTDEGRELSPNLSIDTWDAVLKECGFSGTDMVFRDFEQSDAHETGVIITTAVEETVPLVDTTMMERQCTIVLAGTGDLHRALVEELEAELHKLLGLRPSVLSFEEASQSLDLGSQFLVLLDCESVFLNSITDESWAQLQTLVLQAGDLLWVTAAGGKNPDPGYGILDGLSRVLRSELYGLHLVTLALDVDGKTTSHSKYAMQLVEEMVSTPTHENYEQDYVEFDGKLHTKRIVEANYVRSAVESQLATHHETTTLLSEAVPFALSMTAARGVDSTGGMDSLSLIETSRPTADLKPDEVEIAVKSVSLDRRDHQTMLGLNEDMKFGSYCAGIVARVGTDSQMPLGARVFAACDDSFRSYALSTVGRIVELPDSVTFTQATAALPSIIGAHLALVIDGRIKKGDSVLIQNGASRAGQAAIQLCQQLDVPQLWTTASNEEEKDLIVSRLGVHDRQILSTGSIDRQMKEMFPSKGVDIVLAADFQWQTPQSLSYLKPRGRYVQLASTSGSANGMPAITNVPSTVSLSNIELGEIFRHDPSSAMESLRYSIKHCSDSTFDPVSSDTQYSIARVMESFEHLRGCQDGERVVVEFDPDEEITVKIELRQAYELDLCNTYIVVGGLGGLGLVMARWLVKRGARHLILVSRSGPKTDEARETVAKFRSEGVNVATPLCDAVDQAAVQSMLTSYSQAMPPVKGCILASMALNDTIFEKMTFSQWKSTLDSKVAVSWNFHTLLPKGLDFFILITSMMGVIGGISLANYAAGNTYQDALARHRIAQGERAVALSLGPLVDGGYLTVKTELLDGLDRTKRYVPMIAKELCALLDIYCDPTTPHNCDPVRCQPIMGIKPQSFTLADGGEVPFALRQPFWQHTHHVPLGARRGRQNEANDSAAHGNTRQLLLLEAKSRVLRAATVEEAADIVTPALAQRVASLLAISEDRLELEKPMHSYGIDSLTAVDMRNWILNVFEVDLAVFDILGGASFTSAGLLIARKTMGRRGQEVEAPA